MLANSNHRRQQYHQRKAISHFNEYLVRLLKIPSGNGVDCLVKRVDSKVCATGSCKNRYIYGDSEDQPLRLIIHHLARLFGAVS